MVDLTQLSTSELFALYYAIGAEVWRRHWPLLGALVFVLVVLYVLVKLED